MPNEIDTHPVAVAVAPLRSEAVKRAETEARKAIQHRIDKLEAAGWNLYAVAPSPTGQESRAEYSQMKALQAAYAAITEVDTRDPDHYRHNRYRRIVKFSPERAERYVRDAQEDAAAQYDAFVAKLVEKVGDAVSATLDGSHVWGYSVLTVTKADGSVTRWQTRQIVNVSSLGKLFNQWPTRAVR